MEKSNFIKFLGTAGARFVVAKQLRASGGVYMELMGKRIILDPGPGTLVRCAASRPKIDITKIDWIILTHVHIDHSNDVNVLIDAITEGGLKKRGILFAPHEALEGKNAVVFKYVQPFLKDIVILEPDRRYEIDGLRFYTSIRHEHPVDTCGVMFDVENERISFMVDTKFFPGLIGSYKDSTVLIMNVVRLKPHEKFDIKHLCVDDARELIMAIKPRKAILTHFGMTMIKAGPYKIAQTLSEETGIEVISASDGMKVEF